MMKYPVSMVDELDFHNYFHIVARDQYDDEDGSYNCVCEQLDFLSKVL